MSVASRARAQDQGTVYQNQTARLLWLALVYGLGVLPFIEAITAPRIFDEDKYFATLSTHGATLDAAGIWSGRFIALVTLGLGVVCVGVGLTRRRFPRRGLLVWASAMLLSAGPLLSSRFGTHPRFTPALLAAPLMFSALLLLPAVDPLWVTVQIRRVLLVYVYGSLLAILVAPTWALEYPYVESYVPDFDVRLHGIAAHANNLSLLLACYLTLDWFVPRRRTTLDVVNSIVTTAALLLTQSKTVIAILLLFVVVRAASSTLKRYPGIRYPVGALGGVVGTALLSAAMGRIEWGHLRRMISIGQSPLFTLTGRTLIWAYTVSVWIANPLFGYGPTLWDGDMRLKAMAVTGFAAPHAHNQFFESLGEAGIIGVVGLVLYTGVLLYAAFKSRRQLGAAPCFLVWLLVLRGISEPFFRPVMGDPNFFVHFMTFGLVVLTLKLEPRVHPHREIGQLRSPRLPLTSCPTTASS